MATTIDLPTLNLGKQGKLRHIYDMGDALLVVASGRIAAFDAVMPEDIPDKGKILEWIMICTAFPCPASMMRMAPFGSPPTGPAMP